MPAPPEIAALRERLRGLSGRRYWRSLEELAQTPEFLLYLGEEFPRFAAAAEAAFDRRRFLQLMGASLALAGMAGCGEEAEPRVLVPYIQAPPGIIPGRANFYATALIQEGFATGVLLKHVMGRPIKVEGNPDHPASLGGTDPFIQASILDLYDPNRGQGVRYRGHIRGWDPFVDVLTRKRAELLGGKGKGLRLLTGAVTSPTLAGQIADLLKTFPEAGWHQWEAAGRDRNREGSALAFGRGVETVAHFDKADVILAVGSDFLSYAPGHLHYARDFARRRRAAEAREEMSRLYALESTPTLAGSMADHRLALPPAALEDAMRELAGLLGVMPFREGPEQRSKFLTALADDLRRHQGACLVHIGREQPAALHAIGHALNDTLGAPGKTLDHIDPVEAKPIDQTRSLSDLAHDMADGKVDTLIILGAANPAFTAPSDLGFAQALERVGLSVYLGPHPDETAASCTWYVPEAHDYERWSDARAYDGTATIQQPQLRPLWDGKSAHELLAVLAGDIAPDGHALIRESWRKRAPQYTGGGDFDGFWTAALRRGTVDDSAAKPVSATLRRDWAAALPAPSQPERESAVQALFRPDEAVWDGRFAENAWLQELPRPLSKLTWDNAALIAPKTAARLGLANEDLVELRAGKASVRAPVWILPGQAEDCVTLPLGYGRRVSGPVASGTGFDAYPLRESASLWLLPAVEIVKTGDEWPLATTQHHQSMEGRDIIRAGSLAEFLKDPEFLKTKKDQEHPTLYTPPPYPDQSEADKGNNAWAMAINLNSCIGCLACVAACQAENNVPVVGKAEVLRGHEMHWLRIDRYYRGAPDAPETLFQPVPCMHCEDAPCEVVCPVQATLHDHDGLNLMVYNRCVGTRFCSNNCPYKVRRFNFFGYTREKPNERVDLGWNPDVTVRGRGVMEKCNYCVQRIREARITADREDRAIHEDEVVTACAAACPTEAIVFGDLNQRDSAVAKRKESPLDYPLLEELNTRPRTTYEARIGNPNPALAEPMAKKEGG